MLACIRGRLLWLVVAWLLLYAGVSTVVARSAIFEACGCPAMAVGQICPMHHSSSSSARCRLMNAREDSNLALWSVFSSLGGALPVRCVSVQTLNPFRYVDTSASLVIDRSDVPEAPPPRA